MSTDRHNTQLMWIIVLQLIVAAICAFALVRLSERMHIMLLPEKPAARPASLPSDRQTVRLSDRADLFSRPTRAPGPVAYAAVAGFHRPAAAHRPPVHRPTVY